MEEPIEPTAEAPHPPERPIVDLSLIGPLVDGFMVLRQLRHSLTGIEKFADNPTAVRAIAAAAIRLADDGMEILSLEVSVPVAPPGDR